GIRLKDDPRQEQALIEQQYQIRVQSAAEEFQKNRDLKALRAEMARAWEEKIIGPAEREHRLAEEEKASRVQAIQSTAQFQVRLHELQAAPGEWFSIVQFAYNRALDTANQIYEITHKEADLRK